MLEFHSLLQLTPIAGWSVFVEQFALLITRFTLIFLHCVKHTCFETLVIHLSELDYLVKVKDDGVGDKANGDH